MNRLLKHGVRVLLALSIALLLVGGLTRSAAAFDVRGGNNVTIGKDEVINDDLILTGNTVIMNGTINGNLFVFGTQAEINGVVNGSLVFGGQSVTLNGTVRDSLYGGASALTLGSAASVGRNLAFGGFGLKAEAGSQIGRDLAMGGYQLQLNGTVARNLWMSGAALEINGKVGGNVNAQVDAPTAGQMPPFVPFGYVPPPILSGLRVSKDATIGGRLTYTSPAEQAGAILAAPASGVAFQMREVAAAARPDPYAWVWGSLREFTTLLVLGLLAVWKLPALMNRVEDKVRAKPLPSAGWGLLVLIGGFAVAFLTALAIIAVAILTGLITFGGLGGTVAGVGFAALGLAFSIFLLMILYGSDLVIADLMGKFVLQRLAPQYAQQRVGSLVIGIVLYVLIAAIPFLGGLFGIVATLIGLGAMWYVLSEKQAARPAITAAAV